MLILGTYQVQSSLEIVPGSWSSVSGKPFTLCFGVSGFGEATSLTGLIFATHSAGDIGEGCWADLAMAILGPSTKLIWESAAGRYGKLQHEQHCHYFDADHFRPQDFSHPQRFAAHQQPEANGLHDCLLQAGLNLGRGHLLQAATCSILKTFCTNMCILIKVEVCKTPQVHSSALVYVSLGAGLYLGWDLGGLQSSSQTRKSWSKKPLTHLYSAKSAESKTAKSNMTTTSGAL